VRVGCPEEGHCWMSVDFGKGDGCGKGFVGRREETGRRTWMEMEVSPYLGVCEPASEE